MIRSIYRPILIALMLLACGLGASALSTSYYKDASVLSQGRWVKVKVNTTGMQEITFDQLRALGFTSPEKVAVYGYPGSLLRDYNFSESIPDDLPAVASAVYGDKLVFYGVADGEVVTTTNSGTSSNPVEIPRFERNLDNLYSYYYLTDSRQPLRVEVVDAEAEQGVEPVTRGRGLAYVSPKSFKFGNGRVGAYVFGPDVVAHGPQSYTISMPGFDEISGVRGTTFTGAMGSMHNLSGDVALRVTFPGGAYMNMRATSGYGTSSEHKSYFYSQNLGRYVNSSYATEGYVEGITPQESGMYEVTTSMVNPANKVVTGMALDYFCLAYPRTTAVDGTREQYIAVSNISAGQPVNVGTPASGVRIWEASADKIAREFAIRPLAGGSGEYGVVADRGYKMNAQGGALRLIAFDPTQQLNSVEVMGQVKNQNWHSADVPEMLIVASDVSLDAARNLAQLHAQYTGVDCLVVPYSELINEFSSGVPHPMAVRRMAKMFYDRDPERFKAVLLYARAASDNTGASLSTDISQLETTYIPMVQCMDPAFCGLDPQAYSTDCLVGMLADDNFKFERGSDKGDFLRAPIDVMVGRIPALTESEARGYVVKAENYLKNSSDRPSYNRAIIMSDFGDDNMHVVQGSQLGQQIRDLSPSTVPTKLFSPLYVYTPEVQLNFVRNRLLRQLERGSDYWIFIGHSAMYSRIGPCGVYDTSVDKNLALEVPPFFIGATCESLIYDTDLPSLQVEMTHNPIGGNICGVGPTRTVYAHLNMPLSVALTHVFYTQKPGDKFGDVFRVARNMLCSNQGQETLGVGMALNSYVNLMIYNFAGDPMMPRYIPSGEVVLTEIDDQAISGARVDLIAGSRHKFAGEVRNPDGSLNTGFNGRVTIALYDGPHTVKNLNDNVTDAYKTIDLDDELLQEITLDVVGGKFSGESVLITPTFLSDTKANLVSLYAINADRSQRSAGAAENIFIGQPDADSPIEQVEPPVITEFYAQSPEFVRGGVLPSAFDLFATIECEPGTLAGFTDNIGSSSLVVDNSRAFSNIANYFVRHDDGTTTMTYPVSGLSDGHHTIEMRLLDVSGNITTRSIDFTVVNTSQGRMTVDSPHARTAVKFDIEHNLADPAAGRLVICDDAGRAIYTRENTTFPFTWDLRDANHGDVASGRYTARCYFAAGLRHGESEPVSFYIAR